MHLQLGGGCATVFRSNFRLGARSAEALHLEGLGAAGNYNGANSKII